MCPGCKMSVFADDVIVQQICLSIDRYYCDGINLLFCLCNQSIPNICLFCLDLFSVL